MNGDHWIIVGSGPSGVSAAQALISRGQKVTLIDSGIQIEKETETIVSDLGKQQPETWDSASIEAIKLKTAVNSSGIPRKKIFGSEFPFDRTGVPWDYKPSGVGCFPSFAEGGLSNVWGAAVLPVRSSEIVDWPISRRELDPHYQAVESFMPISGTSHDLIDWFSLNASLENRSRYQLSQQALRLLEDLEHSKDNLRRLGFQYGQSRLAARVKNCNYCALCMYGCPYGLIYKSTSTLKDLEKTGLLIHMSGLILESLSESTHSVEACLIDRKTGTRSTLQGDRLFLACGPIESTRLLLNLTKLDPSRVTLQDNQYLLFPWVRYASTPDVKQERLHTLSQLFFEIENPELSKYSVHIQAYSYNDLFPRALKSVAFGLGTVFQPLDSHLFSRFWMLQTYFHSHDSPGIRVDLQKNATGMECLELKSHSPSEFHRSRQKAILSYFKRHSKFFKAFPVSFMARFGLAGSGNHLGSSFPMARDPVTGQTDLWGRPFGFSRIHAVDSSVLPSVPATTMTYTVMANAHRIATESHEKFKPVR